MDTQDSSSPASESAWPSLVAAMRAANIDAATLAERLDMSESGVGHWLAGRANPRLPRLRVIAQVLAGNADSELLPRLLSDMPDPSKYEAGERSAPAWPSLVAAMRSANVTDQQLAEAVGVGWWTVHNWRTGQTTPHRKRVRDIAAALAPPEQVEALRERLLSDMPEESKRTQRATPPSFSAAHSN